MTQHSKINSDTKLSEILSQPGATEILIRHQIPCLSCPFASQEMSELSLGMIAERYNLPLKEILEDLNRGL